MHRGHYGRGRGTRFDFGQRKHHSPPRGGRHGRGRARRAARPQRVCLHARARLALAARRGGDRRHAGDRRRHHRRRARGAGRRAPHRSHRGAARGDRRFGDGRDHYGRRGAEHRPFQPRRRADLPLPAARSAGRPARPLHPAALSRRAPRAHRALRAHRRHQPAHGRRHDAVGPARRCRGVPAGGLDLAERRGRRALLHRDPARHTLRKQAETEAARIRGELGEAQTRLAAIVDSAMDAVITVDEEQKIVLFNRAAEQVFGVRREGVLGTPLDRLLPARFRGAHRAHIAGFGSTGVTSRRMGDVTTLWALRPDSGDEFPIEASISQAVESGKRYYTVILRDITLRKQAEDALRQSQRELRELSARVLEAREEEKAHIARELHDELGQLLTALKMDLRWLRERLPDAELGAKADDMSELLDKTVASTRRISADLRPLMLDDLGLADAANWLVEDFAKRSGVRCEIRIPGEADFESLSKGVSTAVYRALQESLTNIGRHAGARSAWVMLAMEGGELLVEVEDDGRGIAPEDLAKVRSLGLKGMRERVAYLGGSLEIGRAPRGGTRLRLRVP